MGLEQLTEGERVVLRELLSHGHQGVVAKRLGLSPETVKTHLRNAREKCGSSSSFGLARQLADHEAHTPLRGIPRIGAWADGGSFRMDGASVPQDRDGLVCEVREERAIFDFEGMPVRAETRTDRGSSGSSGGLRRLFAVGGLVIMVALAIIVAFPLAESFQRLANVLDPPMH